MKKILFLFLIPVFILMFRFEVLAAPSGSDLHQFYQDNYYTITGINTTESSWVEFVNSCPNYSNYDKYYMGIKKIDYAGTAWQFCVFACSDSQVVSVENGTFSVNSGTMRVFYTRSNQVSYSGYSDTSSYSGGVQNWVSEIVILDFSNPYYDPLLPVPEVEIKYNMTDYSSGNVPILPISIALTNADSGYYVQAVMVNYMPSTVAVKYQDYDALMSHKFEQHNLIPAEMLKTSSDLSADDLGNLAENAWSQDVVSYPVSNVVFTNQIGTDSGAASAYQNMIDQYTIARKIGLFYGNNTEFYFRYFYIDDSDRFVVSAWRTWSSAYSNSFGLAMPSYYKTYSSASGYENTDNNTSIVISPTSQPSVVNPSNNYGKKTGSPININIGSNVPNYPDYPTIATYNTDNLLVNALDTAKQLPDFFTSSIAIFNGMFSGLLPEPFWGIIMTGFLFSIVIMIIKVL